MTKRHTVAALAVLALALATPRSVWAQVVPSPPWGEPIPDASLRFVVLASYFNQAVYDNETGLVWEQAPNTGPRNWSAAQAHCITKTVGNRKAWRLPTIQELASLVDPTQTNPALPANHPFSNVVLFTSYWSATTYAVSSAFAWSVFSSDGVVDIVSKSSLGNVWCVRGGQGPDVQ